nr:hypothetical protein [Gammaproteobacteria bacterium]
MHWVVIQGIECPVSAVSPNALWRFPDSNRDEVATTDDQRPAFAEGNRANWFITQSFLMEQHYVR